VVGMGMQGNMVVIEKGWGLEVAHAGNLRD